MSPVRKLPYPEDGHRVETGVVRFGDDWPAIHIRGDNAYYFAAVVREAIANPNHPIVLEELAGLADLLESCNTALIPKEEL